MSLFSRFWLKNFGTVRQPPKFSRFLVKTTQYNSEKRGPSCFPPDKKRYSY